MFCAVAIMFRVFSEDARPVHITAISCAMVCPNGRPRTMGPTLPVPSDFGCSALASAMSRLHIKRITQKCQERSEIMASRVYDHILQAQQCNDDKLARFLASRKAGWVWTLHLANVIGHTWPRKVQAHLRPRVFQADKYTCAPPQVTGHALSLMHMEVKRQVSLCETAVHRTAHTHS